MRRQVWIFCWPSKKIYENKSYKRDIFKEYLQLPFRKRYDKAEKEFVDAKLQMHRKQERKDLLTEHLMTIIEDSELRKAKKLAELMQQLQIPDCDSTNRGE